MSSIHRLFRVLLTLIALLALLPVAVHAQTGGDGTTSEEWTLDNGLRVMVRNVPGTAAVAIVTAYGIGRLDDPAGNEGFTRLMAESAFMAESGDIPVRSRAELDQLRPIGWNVQVERDRTEFAELTSKEQFPGVLHQVALRMRGATMTDDVVAAAREVVTADLKSQYVDDVGAQLYAEIGWHAAGGTRASMTRWMSGQGIAKVRTRELAKRAAEVYVPANAVLSLAGDFVGVNLRAFTEREFGDIPMGTKLSRPAAPRGTSSHTEARFAQVPRALGGVGVIAPAIADTSHPSFYLTMLMFAMHAGIQWGQPNSPLSSRFHYSIFDDPSVARFYPPVKSKSWTAINLSVQLAALAEQFNGLNVDYESVQRVQLSVEWLLGGPLPETLQERVKTDPPVLYRLASSDAARRLLGDADFWKEYRRRFDPTVGAGYAHWHEYIRNKGNHSAVMYMAPQ